MKRSLLAGEALAEHLGALVDEDAHAAFLVAAITFLAASVRSAAAMIARALAASRSRAIWALVPSSRTTTGTPTPTFLTALMMPSAIRSQRTMPPKMFTRMARTCGLDRIS